MEEQKTSSCECGSDCGCFLTAKNPLTGVLVILTLVLVIYVGVLIRNGLKTHNYIGKTPDMINQITVTGTAKVSAIPDVASINLGIVSEGKSVAEAQKGVTDKMNKIIESLKNDFQVESKDIKTENFSVSPKYDWSNGRQNIIGYSVNQNISVKIRNFDKIGQVLTKVVELGANTVYGPNFIIDDPEAYKAEAREKAISQAKDKAEILASQVGIRLGRIVNFYEGEDDMVVAYGRGGMTESMDMQKSSVPTIEPGSQDIILNVYVSYEIK